MAKNISGPSIYHSPTAFQGLVWGICLGFQNLHPTSTLTLWHGQAGRLSVLSQCPAELEWKDAGETLEHPEDQCGFGLVKAVPATSS